MNGIKLSVSGIKELFTGEKRVRVIVALGLLGMALILLSQFWPAKKSDGVQTPDEALSNELYIDLLEKKLGGLIESIEGVGRAKVMVTLDSSAKMVYATEETTRTDHVQDVTGEERKKVQESGNTQVSYILVDRGSGQKEPLVTTRLEPTVKGVVVVCPGADNRLISVRIVDVVTTALGIGANKVCVVKGGG